MTASVPRSSFTRAVLTIALASSLGFLSAAQAAAPPAPQLSFKGYGLTADHKLVRIYGNNTQYTVWPEADLSALPWESANDWHNGLASDPWNGYYLYISVGTDASWGTELYRYDIVSHAIVHLATFPIVGTPWWSPLEGLGAECNSKFANVWGGAGLLASRTQGTGNVYHVREITTTGHERELASSTSISRFGDNTSQILGGPQWFTHYWWGSWGVNKLDGTTIWLGTNDLPTGLLGYGGSLYYLSAAGAKMYKVDTTAGTATLLNYIVWGVPALPAAPELLDLSNGANFCSPILP